jgi:hypothetical protein
VKGESWQAQCPKGHVVKALPGSELERLIVESYAAGNISAYAIDRDDCPSCILEDRDRVEQLAQYCSLVGCPYTEHCAIGTNHNLCLADEREPSKFADQIYPLSFEDLESPFGYPESFSAIIPGVTLNGQPVFRA